jgi:hypothetical protein
MLDPRRTDEAGRLIAQVAPAKGHEPFEKGVLFLEVLLQTDEPPAKVCRHVAVTFVTRRDARDR